jgi:hypothetical protein
VGKMALVRHACVDCKVESPPTDSNYSLIGLGGWRVLRAVQPNGLLASNTVQYEVWAITSTETPGGWGSPRRLDSASSSCGGQPWPNQIIPFVPYSTGSAASGQFYFGDYIGIVPLSLGLGDPWTCKFSAAWSDSRIAPVVRGDLS